MPRNGISIFREILRQTANEIPVNNPFGTAVCQNRYATLIPSVSPPQRECSPNRPKGFDLSMELVAVATCNFQPPSTCVRGYFVVPTNEIDPQDAVGANSRGWVTINRLVSTILCPIYCGRDRRPSLFDASLFFALCPVLA